MKTTRRGFFGMVAGAVAVAVLPKPKTIPAWRTDSSIVLAKPSPRQAAMMDGLERKLYGGSRGGGLYYWQDDKYTGVYAGISRRQHGQQGQD